MKILGIETSNQVCSVCYLNEDQYYEFNTFNKREHSIYLFDNLIKLQKKTNLDFNKLDYIAVSNGPGSYTGLRIGISTALGIAKNNNIKIKYVDTLLSLTYLVDNNTDYIISILDAKVDRLYFCLYDQYKNSITNNTIINVEVLIELLNKYFENTNILFTFVGDGIINYKKIFKNKLKINYKFVNNKTNYPNAKNIIIASKNIKYNKNVCVNYMQKSNAER